MTVTLQALLADANAAVPRITGDEAIALSKQPGVVIVDVRDTSEVKASGKAKGALAISRGFIEFKADRAAPSHDPALGQATTVIVHCAAGARAALAGNTLKSMGYTDVRNLGRFQDWLDAGGEIEPG